MNNLSAFLSSNLRISHGEDSIMTLSPILNIALPEFYFKRKATGFEFQYFKRDEKRETLHLCRAGALSVQGLKGPRLGYRGLGCHHLSVKYVVKAIPGRADSQDKDSEVEIECVHVTARKRPFNPSLFSGHPHHLQAPGSEAPGMKDSVLSLSLPRKSLSTDFPGGWLLWGTSWHRTPLAG